MKSETKNLPLVFLLYVFIFLFIFYLLPGDFRILGVQIKKFDPIADVKPDSLLSSNFRIEIHPNASGLSMMLPFSITMNTNPQALSGNLQQLKYFYDALKQSKNKVIRIAHYGDSVIEGDLITSDFRSVLQNKFGGEGTGLAPCTAEDIRFKVTVKHTFSSDWKTNSVYGGNQGNLTIGINGTVSIPASGSWVKLEASGIPGSFKGINKAVVYYSDARNSSIKYSLNDGPDKTMQLQTGSGIKQLVITCSGSKSIKLTAVMMDQAKFYGISIESGNGVIIDNFPLRGNSGISIREIPLQVMKEFNNYLDYKLIILQFGLNMITSGQVDYEWYEKEMVKVVNQLKSAFPQTSIVLVSVGDKSIKKGSRFITDPNVVKLVDAQRKIADQTSVAFWNLYESMGGENSMMDWVNSKPPLAMKDYTHFNNEGAKKIGRMLCDAVLNNYK